MFSKNFLLLINIFPLLSKNVFIISKKREEGIRSRAQETGSLKDRLGDQRGGSEWEPIKILLERD
jgi:hypothetical protein